MSSTHRLSTEQLEKVVGGTLQSPHLPIPASQIPGILRPGTDPWRFMPIDIVLTPPTLVGTGG